MSEPRRGAWRGASSMSPRAQPDSSATVVNGRDASSRPRPLALGPSSTRRLSCGCPFGTPRRRGGRRAPPVGSPLTPSASGIARRERLRSGRRRRPGPRRVARHLRFVVGAKRRSGRGRRRRPRDSRAVLDAWPRRCSRRSSFGLWPTDECIQEIVFRPGLRPRG